MLKFQPTIFGVEVSSLLSPWSAYLSAPQNCHLGRISNIKHTAEESNFEFRIVKMMNLHNYFFNLRQDLIIVPRRTPQFPFREGMKGPILTLSAFTTGPANHDTTLLWLATILWNKISPRF